MRYLMTVLLVVGVGSVAFGAKKETYSVDTKSSEVKWVGKKVAGQHDGTIQVKSGTIEFNGDVPVRAEFVIDMTTIKNLDIKSDKRKDLEGHLKSDDFFNVRKFATSKLVANKFVPSNKSGQYNVQGDLTVKGITKPINFPAMIKVANGKANGKANIQIDRTQFDIRYKSKKFFSIKELGDRLIYDEIDFTVDITANKSTGKKRAKSS